MVTFTEIDRKNIWMSAADQLRESIESGSPKPGEKLPSERDLCQQFGISRISLREALRALAQEGYIDIQSGRGAFVLGAQDRRKKVLDGWIEADLESARKTFELRLVIEPGIASLVAHRTSDELLEQLGATIATMENANSTIDDIIEADELFHQLLGENTSNDLISALVHFVMNATGSERRLTLGAPDGIRQAVLGHQKILSAIQKKDPKLAENAMREHLNDAIAFSDPEA